MDKQVVKADKRAKAIGLLNTRGPVVLQRPVALNTPVRADRPLTFDAPVGNQPVPDFDPIQVIYDQNVMPRPNSLDITFATAKGSIPVVSLWYVKSGDPQLDMVPANFVATKWPLGAGIQTRHAFHFDSLNQ